MLLDKENAWSHLSRGTSQVLICDLQEQIVARSKTTRPDEISKSAGVLCRIAEAFDLPLTFSVVPEDRKAPKLIPSLKPFASEQNQFLRTTASPFVDQSTREHLASQDRATFIIAGFATEVVVLHAAMEAMHDGYNVIVAVDACGGMSDRTESATLAQIRHSGGIVSSVVSIATALSPDFADPLGQQVFGIVQELRLT